MSCHETRRAPRFVKATVTSSPWTSTRRSVASAIRATGPPAVDEPTADGRAGAPAAGETEPRSDGDATATLGAGLGRAGGEVGNSSW